MTSRRGFSAECHDCPTMIGTDYGETIYNGVVSTNDSVMAQIQVMEWAQMHTVTEGHRVHVRRYETWDVEVEHIDPEVWVRMSSE